MNKWAKKVTTDMRPRASRSLNRLYELAGEEWKRGELATAFRLFLLVAEAGVKPAFPVVADFYYSGDGTARDEKAALYWYRRAVRELGDSAAANNIGCILRDRREIGKALWWLRRAVRMGDNWAHLNLAKIHLTMRDGRPHAIRHLQLLLAARSTTLGSREEATRLMRKLQATKSTNR